MGLVEAIVLGIVQGLTEFLPISSTAHIRIVPSLVGWPDPGAAFTAVIQLGTIVAVIVYFWGDLCRFFLGWLAGMRDPHRRSSLEWRMGWAIVVGTIPIAIFGLLFKDSIEGSLRSLYVIAIALIALGLLMMVAEIVGRRDCSLEGVRLRDGLWVGFWQALALIPGASRSGTTITGGLFAGLDRPTAARFSFLLSVPSIVLAALFNLAEHKDLFLTGKAELLAPSLVASLAALISGYASIAFLLRFLQKHGTWVFVAYRVVLGGLILVLLANGSLEALDSASEAQAEVAVTR